MSNGIVTLGVFAHANAGKTTLTEQLLKKSGLISVAGRVDFGNTVTDDLEIERKRGITVRASFVTFKLNGNIVQFIDTPGHIEFSSEVIRAINVLDAAILVISGVKGLESQTYTIWNLLKKKNIPTLFFVNKLDIEGADYNRTFNMIRDELTNMAVSLIPTNDSINIESSERDSCNSQLLQNAQKIREKIQSRTIFPVFGGSALKNIGIDAIYHYLGIFLPFSKTSDNLEAKKAFCGYVYMIRHGKTKDIYIKVLQGTLNIRDYICNTLNEADRVKSIFKVVGNKRVSCKSLGTYEIGIVTGLSVKPGMFVGDRINNPNIICQETPLFTKNVFSISDKIAFIYAIQKLAEEYPELNLRYDKHNKSFQIDVIGDLQGDSVVAILKEKYNVDCIKTEARLIYKETPTRVGIGKSSYTSNSGVILKISPLSNGEGILFKSNISVNVLPFKFQKQIEQLVHKYLCYGSKGWSITDACIELEGGKWDHVASISQHYNIAVPVALARAIQRSQTILLEPLMKYEIRFKKSFLGVVLMEITSFQKMYSELDESDSSYIVRGYAFISELKEFMSRTNNITHGHAKVNFELYRYDHNPKGNVEINPVENSPHNIHEFITSQSASIFHLDRGLRQHRTKTKQ